MTKQEFASRLQNACAAVTAAEQELTEIDSRFGDADHGLTMSKIAKAVSAAAGESEGGIQAMLDDAAMAVMVLNGGSAVPLWNTWLDGLQEEAPEGNEIDTAGIQAIFAKALKALSDMSGAKVGDKTMMDALIPASQAMRPGCSTPPPRPRSRGPRPASSSSPSSAVPRATASRPSGPRMPGPPPWPISSRGWHGPERISIDFEREVLHI